MYLQIPRTIVCLIDLCSSLLFAFWSSMCLESFDFDDHEVHIRMCSTRIVEHCNKSFFRCVMRPVQFQDGVTFPMMYLYVHQAAKRYRQYRYATSLCFITCWISISQPRPSFSDIQSQKVFYVASLIPEGAFFLLPLMTLTYSASKHPEVRIKTTHGFVSMIKSPLAAVSSNNRRFSRNVWRIRVYNTVSTNVLHKRDNLPVSST